MPDPQSWQPQMRSAAAELPAALLAPLRVRPGLELRGHESQQASRAVGADDNAPADVSGA